MNRRTAIQTAAVFLPLIAGGATVQAGVGVDYVRATDYATLQAAHDAAAGIASKQLYIPAGVYGDQLSLTADDIDVFGDGPEKTILQLPDAPAQNVFGIHMYGKRQSAEGLSIKGGAIGAGNAYGVSVTFGCSEWRLSDITVSNINGVGGAGGVCFDFYQPSQTNGGYSYGIGKRLTAKDSPNACGFIVNAQGNTFRDCRAVACGNTTLRHGFYIQGGYNTFDTCYAERSAGYNWHNYAAVPDRASSYNVYRGCTSADPVTGHFVASSINAGASNSDVPTGAPLNRGVTLTGCTFRRTPAGAACGLGIGPSVPAVIDGCTFEDVLGSAGAWVGVGAGGRVVNNLFRQTTIPANQNIVGIVASGGAIVSGNQFQNWLAGTAIRADGLSLITGNSLDLYGGVGIYVNGSDVRLRDNAIQVHGSAKAYYGVVV